MLYPLQGASIPTANAAEILHERALHRVELARWHPLCDRLMANIVVSAVLALTIAPLLVGVALAALQLAFSASDWCAYAHHGCHMVLMREIVVATVGTVLVPIATEHLALSAHQGTFVAPDRFPQPSHRRLQAMGGSRVVAAFAEAATTTELLTPGVSSHTVSANRFDIQVAGPVVSAEAAAAMPVSLEYRTVGAGTAAFRAFHWSPTVVWRCGSLDNHMAARIGAFESCHLWQGAMSQEYLDTKLQ